MYTTVQNKSIPFPFIMDLVKSFLDISNYHLQFTKDFTFYIHRGRVFMGESERTVAPLDRYNLSFKLIALNISYLYLEY